MPKTNILITGGAGFIGSNLVKYFLDDERIGLIRVLDNLSNGYYENIKPFISHSKFEFIEGDIRDYQTCLKACKNIDKISHQAALGSVPRSIEDPITSTDVNILGTVKILHAAVQEKVERVVLAFSSSTYGDHKALPKIEGIIGNPLSPYAITKSCIEQYSRVFSDIYGLDWVGLRYFNVFGPNQSPTNPYAAVIPIFCNAAINDLPININGDGNTSRDFTYIENVLKMNDLSLFTTNPDAINQTYNCACGKRTTLNELVQIISEITNKQLKINYKPERKGDVKHSLASIEKANKLLGYTPEIQIKEGLKRTIEHLSQL
jgi:UDP-N-acetylglucosamine 4-epimerase